MFQLGEVKSFIRLLQEDDINAAASPKHTRHPSTNVGEQDETSTEDLFLTLPVLEAFVDGGEAFLANKKRAALARRQSRDVSSVGVHPTATESMGTADVTNTKKDDICRPGMRRANSWTEEGDLEDADNDRSIHRGSEKEEMLLDHLKGVLARVQPTAPSKAGGRVDLGGGVRDYLDSFGAERDGVLSVEEFVAALRSLGVRGEEFHRRSGVEALISRFRDGGNTSAGAEHGASIAKIAWWFDEQVATEPSVGDTANRRDSNGSTHEGDSGSPGNERTLGNETGVVGNEKFVAGEALRRAVRLAEAKGTTLERTFARLDEDGDGFITLRQLLRGLDQLGVFEQVTRSAACWCSRDH